MASAARFDAPCRKMMVMLNSSARRRQRSARWDESRSKVRLRWSVKAKILFPYRMVRYSTSVSTMLSSFLPMLCNYVGQRTVFY